MGGIWGVYALFVTTLFIVAVLFSFYLFIVKPNGVKKAISLSKDKYTEFSPTIKFLIWVALLLILIGFWMPFLFTRKALIADFDFTSTGAIGDTFGGILNPFVALAAVIVTGLAFYMQYQANQQIQDQFKVQQFESQFYKLLDFHRENVKEMSFSLYGEDADGRKVFKLIVQQIETAYGEISPFFENLNLDGIVKNDFLASIKSIKAKRQEIDLAKLIQLDIAYTIVFLGISVRDQYPLTRFLIKKYEKSFIRNIYYFLILKPSDIKFRKEWNTIRQTAAPGVDFKSLRDKWMENLDDEAVMDQLYQDIEYNETKDYEIKEIAFQTLIKNNSIKFYGGHQFRLGHYFRNLFQIYKLIDRTSFLTDIEKFNYSKVIRSQLSSYELYLLFFNSISSLGYEWEFAYIDEQKQNCLISKYQILKNVPDLHIYNIIDIPSFFPDIDYDFR
ncbi:putative phage abortive infection protein [Sphingobacterium sp.]|uniref:putative phage abortive infection protein n=1 Tax=Sphingobacterium sp. TaxID=341027 RepID=UPI0028A004CC|nr:putative phage abortive infection protein [Sphingobacterium sp.]